jgi:sigma-B regulation protein RsbU (phosphoserine phosphatase)
MGAMPLDPEMPPLRLDPLVRAVIDGCEHGLCVLDSSGRLLAMNEAAERRLGVRETDLQGLPPVLAEPIADPGEGEGGGGIRVRLPDRDPVDVRGRIESVPGAGSPLALLHFDAAGPAAGAACDIRASVRAILDTIIDGVIVIDEVGTIRLFNPAAERLFGYSREEALGRNVKMLMPSPDRERHDGYLARYRETGVRKIIGIGREVVGQRKNGSTFPFYLSIGELRQDGERLFVGIVHDLTRRKQAESKLMILSRVVEQSPNSIMIVDLDGRIEYVNRSFCRLTDYSADEVIGLHPNRFPAGETPPEKYRRLWETLRAGGEWQGEIQDRKKTGERYWARETITPIRDGEGRITRYLAVQVDITEQKRNQEALQDSEERFLRVAEMVGEWLWEQDAEGRYTYCSAAVWGILGYRPEEIVGRYYWEFLTPEDRAARSEAAPYRGRFREPYYKLVNHYRHRNGREVYTESTGAPVLDPHGGLVKWRGMDLDITARKRYEDALRLRDRAIEAARVGIVITDARDPAYPVLYANPALCRITGYPREELIGENLRKLQGPDTDAATKARIRDALRQGVHCEVVIKNYRKDGTPFWNELLLSPVRDETGAVTHYIGVQSDVTERLRAEEERHELEIAKQIQLSLLPKTPLRLPQLEIAGVCVPATHVGGDYFDYLKFDHNVDVVIADVSGHSMGAALLMAEMRSTLKAEVHRERHVNGHPGIADILKGLNDVMFGDLSGADLFITMFYLRYELNTRRLYYANAGHNRALLLRYGLPGCVELDADGLILGVRPEVDFEEKSLFLAPGDCVLLYTDGVVEARNEQGELFGFQRLCRLVCAHRRQRPEDMIERLLDELRVFRGTDDFTDDVSMVALRIG